MAARLVLFDMNLGLQNLTCFLFKLFLIKAATRYVLWKRLFLEIPQYSPENNLKPATLLNLQLVTLLKTDSNTGVFKEHQRKAASVLNVIHYVTIQAFPQKRRTYHAFHRIYLFMHRFFFQMLYVFSAFCDDIKYPTFSNTFLINKCVLAPRHI